MSDPDQEYENGEGSESEWDEEDENEALVADRDLLWLCQEGQLELALARVKSWDGETNDDMLARHRRELFKVNGDGNTALHEILMGGSNDDNSDLVRSIVEKCFVDRRQESILFARQPRSHGRTLLHWAAWGKCDASVVKIFVSRYPEALCLRDGASHGRRTPLEIAQRYWPESDVTSLLRQRTASYLQYRLRLAVHLSVHHHFVTNRLTPMDKNDRKRSGLAPRPFFVASVLGYALQREMLAVVLNVLSFLGTGAKQNPKKRKGSGGSNNSARKGNSRRSKRSSSNKKCSVGG